MENIEIWKDVEDWEGMYQISNHGNGKSLARLRKSSYDSYSVVRERILKPQKDRYGYIHFNFSKDGKRVIVLIHRLVAEAFIPNPNNYPYVLHIDNNKSNCKVDNLKWGTQLTNVQDAWKDGLMSSADRALLGEQNHFHKLTENDVRMIRNLYNNGERSRVDLSKQFNLHQCTVSRILAYRTWKHI